MNWRRGLFVIAVALISYGDIKRGPPNKTFEFTRPDGRTFDVKAPDMQSAIAVVKALPEGFVPDKPISDADVGLAPNPWAIVVVWAAIAVGISVLGSSLVCALSGFAATRT
jgi:hypothetical protein